MKKYKPTEDQMKRLTEFAELHGRNWKSILRKAWLGNHSYSGYCAELQQIRNDWDRPSSWLDKIVIKKEK
jgi:hypothetical protein